MGVTIKSKNYSIDLGYFGFFRLRKKIAELVGEDVGIHYDELNNTHVFATSDEEEKYWKEYDKVTESIANSYPKNVWKVFDFLYQSDTDGFVSYGTCKQILAVIGDYDDDEKYGYAGRDDCAMFRDFKKLLQDCVNNKCRLEWL